MFELQCSRNEVFNSCDFFFPSPPRKTKSAFLGLMLFILLILNENLFGTVLHIFKISEVDYVEHN